MHGCSEALTMISVHKTSLAPNLLLRINIFTVVNHGFIWMYDLYSGTTLLVKMQKGNMKYSKIQISNRNVIRKNIFKNRSRWLQLEKLASYCDLQAFYPCGAFVEGLSCRFFVLINIKSSLHRFFLDDKELNYGAC